MMMDVSICIVNWNTKEKLHNCIESIYANTKDLKYEIIVVDNDSSDGSAKFISEEFAGVNLVRSEENLGFARASNLAAEKAAGKYVLYLNPDTALATNALKGMMQLLESNSEVGAVGCQILNSDGTVQKTCASDYPTPWNQICSLLGLDRLFPNVRIFSGRELNYWDHKESRNVECISGACIMLSKALNDRLQGFDTKFFMYGEDIDLCMRIAQSGLSVHYMSSEIIYHYEGSASKARERDFAHLRQRAAHYRILSSHFGVVRAMTYRVAVFVGCLARVVGMGIVSPILLATGRMEYESVLGFLGRYGKLLMWASGMRQVHIASRE